MSKGTLKYVRVATKGKDSCDGLLYIHQWPTGHQELVMVSEAHADKFGKAEDVEVTHNKQPAYDVRYTHIIVVDRMHWGKGKTLQEALTAMPFKRTSVPRGAQVYRVTAVTYINTIGGFVVGMGEPEPLRLNPKTMLPAITK